MEPRKKIFQDILLIRKPIINDHHNINCLKLHCKRKKTNLILSLHDDCKSRIAPCTSKFDIYVFVMVLFAGDIDFVTHYRLVDPNKLESYAKAFVVEDDDLDTKLSFKVSKLGIFFSFH